MLEVVLCLTLLDLAVTGAARFTAYRLKCQGEWRNTGLGHRKLEFLQKYPFTLKQDRILKKYQLVKQYKVKCKLFAIMSLKSTNPILLLQRSLHRGMDAVRSLSTNDLMLGGWACW